MIQIITHRMISLGIMDWQRIQAASVNKKINLIDWFLAFLTVQ